MSNTGCLRLRRRTLVPTLPSPMRELHWHRYCGVPASGSHANVMPITLLSFIFTLNQYVFINVITYNSCATQRNNGHLYRFILYQFCIVLILVMYHNI